MLAKLRDSLPRRKSKGSSTESSTPYPSLPPSQHFYEPHQPIASTSAELMPAPPATPPPELTQEELDAVFAQQMYDEEEKERELRLAEDEKIVLELVERERAEHEREQTEAERQARELEEQLFDADLRQENGVLECELCYGEFYRGEVMVQCPECHILCRDCAIAGARVAFENLDASLPCLADGDCGSFYPPDEARKFLDEQQWARLEKLRLEADIAILTAEGLKMCPFCPYAVILDDPEATELDCLNPDCARRTCLSCKHITHLPLSCAQANPNPFNRLAEAMSEDMIRRCPNTKCLKPFVKTGGCNAITCTDKNCRTKSCYLCKSLIDGYSHFDNGPCKGKLYKDDSVIASVKQVRDQGIASLETEADRKAARRLQVG
ncbi:hypothetical protein BCR35DRAFT_298856 [Leucosporidium creatinivorum]|uniref:RING-type domain-containing protein n=1 Tax=Leucosporidium creatinivorum TaxID=106004 RepID=A0A1Y2G2K9_9BASI|nr:hypothetical protein BCR35DRAFT_298856 [Leucosporidium creatinivorum]